MDYPHLKFAKANITELPLVKALLKQHLLPTEDLNENVQLFVLKDHNIIIGTVGLEQYGNVALIRSIGILPNYKNKAYGTHIVEKAHDYARILGIKKLFLLTTTAASFFAKLGYQKITKTDAPNIIRASEEFKNICPDSAVCMRFVLETIVEDKE